jgi:hypothetical protein
VENGIRAIHLDDDVNVREMIEKLNSFGVDTQVQSHPNHALLGGNQVTRNHGPIRFGELV